MQVRRKSLGDFRLFPTEVLHLVLSYLPVRTLSLLAQVSRGWNSTLAHWIFLKSTAWQLAPSRCFPYNSEEFYDQYAELGLLCRRVIMEEILPDRVHMFWKVLERVECASALRDPLYKPSFRSAAMFYRASTPLHLGSSKHKFQAAWGILMDTIGMEVKDLDVRPAEFPRLETDMRICLRILFLLPHVNTDSVTWHPVRQGRATVLRALMLELTIPQQAKFLYICFGPRAGGVNWNAPCNVAFTSLAQMAFIVHELGAAVAELTKVVPQEVIQALVRQIIHTPTLWLPRYQVMLFLSMGPRAAARFLAGSTGTCPADVLPAVRMAQMACLGMVYQTKAADEGEDACQPVRQVAATSVVDVFDCYVQLTQLGPALCRRMAHDILDEAFDMAINVDYDRDHNLWQAEQQPSFAIAVLNSLLPLLDRY